MHELLLVFSIMIINKLLLHEFHVLWQLPTNQMSPSCLTCSLIGLKEVKIYLNFQK